MFGNVSGNNEFFLRISLPRLFADTLNFCRYVNLSNSCYLGKTWQNYAFLVAMTIYN